MGRRTGTRASCSSSSTQSSRSGSSTTPERLRYLPVASAKEAALDLRMEQLLLPMRVEQDAVPVFAERRPRRMIEERLERVSLRDPREPRILEVEEPSREALLQGFVSRVRGLDPQGAFRDVELTGLGGGLHESAGRDEGWVANDDGAGVVSPVRIVEHAQEARCEHDVDERERALLGRQDGPQNLLDANPIIEHAGHASLRRSQLAAFEQGERKGRLSLRKGTGEVRDARRRQLPCEGIEVADLVMNEELLSHAGGNSADPLDVRRNRPQVGRSRRRVAVEIDTRRHDLDVRHASRTRGADKGLPNASGRGVSPSAPRPSRRERSSRAAGGPPPPRVRP